MTAELLAFAREMLPICPEIARKMVEHAIEKGKEMRANATAENARLRAEKHDAVAARVQAENDLVVMRGLLDEARGALELIIDWARCDRDNHGRTGMAGGYAIARAALAKLSPKRGEEER